MDEIVEKNLELLLGNEKSHVREKDKNQPLENPSFGKDFRDTEY